MHNPLHNYYCVGLCEHGLMKADWGFAVKDYSRHKNLRNQPDPLERRRRGIIVASHPPNKSKLRQERHIRQMSLRRSLVHRPISGYKDSSPPGRRRRQNESRRRRGRIWKRNPERSLLLTNLSYFKVETKPTVSFHCSINTLKCRGVLRDARRIPQCDPRVRRINRR